MGAGAGAAELDELDDFGIALEELLDLVLEELLALADFDFELEELVGFALAELLVLDDFDFVLAELDFELDELLDFVLELDELGFVLDELAELGLEIVKSALLSPVKLPTPSMVTRPVPTFVLSEYLTIM